MTPIAATKTREDAVALIDALAAPAQIAAPAPLKDDATPAQKTAFETQSAEAARRNAFIAREAGLISDVQTLVKSRIAALPTEVKVIGIDVRADTGDLEFISVRIIPHK